MRELYPPIAPDHVELLDVGHGHTVYVEQCGRHDGLPVVFLHGGPGGGCKADHRQFFDPERYRVFLVDQRGAGRSRPVGGVDHNTTDDLIADLETVRERHGVDRWVLFGGSWGAALALAYAEACPERVSGLVLRGTFLARRSDVDWFFSAGANRLLPMQWQAFLDAMQLPPGADFHAALYDGIFSDKPSTVERVARAWEAWSGAVVMYSIDSVGEGGAGPLDLAIAKARIEMHYAHHRYFMRENQLLEDIGRVPRVPTIIVHGARDITCTAEAAFAAHRALPGSRFEVLRSAGHLSSERPMIDALVRAADEIADRLG
ncbi:MAG: prolyl aminopeptidase [Gammaproteobacteria bacterium]|nr:prolyl aminopeptidase [Gammaproteobacteria bacterium]